MRRLCCLCPVGMLALALLDPAAAGQRKQPRLDPYGDPLPEGALLRIGSTRLQTGAAVVDLTFSHDGKRLITANRTTGIHVWDVATGKELRHLPCDNPDDRSAPERRFAGIVLSPGGTHVAEVNNKGVVSVREVATGHRLRLDKQPWTLPHLVRFAPNDRTVAIVNFSWKLRKTTVHLYAVAAGKLLRSPTYDHDPNGSHAPVLRFSSDGQAVTLASLDSQVHLYDAGTGKRFVARRSDRENGYDSGVFSPDGKLLAAYGTYRDHVNLFEVATSKCVATMKDFRCYDLRFTADSRLVVGLTDKHDGEVKVFEAATGKHVRTIHEGGWLESVAVSPDGKYLASIDGGTVLLRHLDTGLPVHPFPNPRATWLTARFAADGKTITSTSQARYRAGGSASLWDAANGKLLSRLAWPGLHGARDSLADGGRLLSNTRAGHITVTEVGTRRIVLQVGAANVYFPVILSPDGSALLARFFKSESPQYDAIRLWDVATGKKLLEIEQLGSGDLYGYFDGSGRILVVGKRQHIDPKTVRKTLACYDVATGRLLPRSTLQQAATDNYVVSSPPMIAPNGWLLVDVPRLAGPLVLRELATRQILATLPHRGHVISPNLVYYHGNNDRLAFSPNGRLLAAATASGVVLVWDLATAEVVAELQGHRGTVWSVSWSRDGKRLLSSGQDTTLLVWDAAPWWARVAQAAHRLEPAQLQSLWHKLATVEGRGGYDAVWQLVRAPKQAVALLRKQLPPAGPKEVARSRALIADLNTGKFAVREKAQAALAKLGDLAQPSLEHALTGSPTLEVRRRIQNLLQKLDQPLTSAAALQELRALAVLEQLGSADAKALLQELAGGEAEAWRTREARAALRRLEPDHGRHGKSTP